MNMLLLEEIVLQEKHRIEFMISSYEDELKSLPRGSVVKKNIRGNSYCYLQYRNGTKTVSEYLGNNEELIQQTISKLKRRKHIEGMLKKLNQELSYAQKIGDM